MTTRNIEHLAATVAEHIEADAVVQGDYWSEDEQKGCFIGCLVHADRPDLIEERYGIPVMITKIAEAIFERLPADEAKQFFADFPAAINNDGKDLSRVGWQFLAQTLRDLPPITAEVQDVVDLVVAGLDRLAEGEEWSSAAARAAAVRACDAAAAMAADAARAAAWAAAWVHARVHAWAAARAAARAAAAWDSAKAADAKAADWTAAIRQQRDLLLRLIREA